MKKAFWVLIFAIIIVGFLTWVYAIHNNNIFFTVDEGRDAVYARQIINYHEIFTKGPQATLKGLYTGPLWYYVVSLGYFFTKGNPMGAVLVLVIINLATTFLLMIVLKRKVDQKISLIAGFGLIFFWDFFTTSLWGFNPFALVSIAFILILLLTKNKYGLAVIPIILAFNAELAGAIALLIFYILIGAYYVYRKEITIKKYFTFAFLLPIVGVSKILIDFVKSQIQVVGTTKNTLPTGATHIGGTNFKEMAVEFVKMLGRTTFPEQTYIGFLILAVVVIIYLKLKKKNNFSKKFVFLTFTLVISSYFFFASNHGWSAWHTAFIPPLLFVSLLLMLWEFGKIKYLLISVLIFFQLMFFKNNLGDYLKPSPNPSLLYNQMKVIDWIYTHSENNGFDLYTYTDSFYDYSYQYLIGWYGKEKYGFYPCEYSNFPLSNKSLYIPQPQNYVSPQLGCDKFRFLIIDSDTNGNENKNWIVDYRNQTIFLESVKIGNTTIEKRKVPDKIR